MPDHIVLQAAQRTIHLYTEARQYDTDDAALAAWKAVMRAQIPDAGASRCKHPQDPTGPARYVIYLTFGHTAWSKLTPYTQGGTPWEAPADLVKHVVERRLSHVAAGGGSFTYRATLR